MNALKVANNRITPRREQRAAARCSVAVPGRLTWKDARGAARFASVVTRDVSDLGVFVEWRGATAIPLYRLVQFQVEREARDVEGLPAVLRSGRVLSAVYRIGGVQRDSRTPDGYGLRLLVEPRREAAAAPSSGTFATTAIA